MCRASRRESDMPRWRRIIGIAVTFHVVCFGWIMFRASDLQTARNMLSQILPTCRN